jgi:hypothetical protein
VEQPHSQTHFRRRAGVHVREVPSKAHLDIVVAVIEYLCVERQC